MVARLLLSAAILAATAATAAAADPVLPLAQVEPGMVGEARTVVRGTEIARFPVRVISVDHERAPQVLGTLGPAILIEASGPVIDRAGGIAAGMSGSPVYVTGADGVERVMGAVSFGTGDERNRIGGVTPIEHMLQVAHGSPRPRAARQAAAVRPSRVVADRRSALALERRRPDARGFYPLRSWTAAGISAPLLAPLRRGIGGAESRRLVPVTRAPSLPDAPFAPGSSLSAQLIGGDVRLGAVGTTTYVTNDGRVLGFGHPFLGTGATRLIMGGGYVHTVVAAPIANYSYKLADPGPPRGAITADRTAGVLGRPGAVDATEVVLRSFDKGTGARTELRALMSPDARLAPFLSELLQREGAFRVRDAIFSPGTVSMTAIVESPALGRPLVYRNRYATVSDAVFDSEPIAARITSLLLRNGVARIPVRRLTIVQSLENRIRAARIVRARVVPARLRPGQSARLRLRIQPWRQGARTLTIPITVPRRIRPGIRGVSVEPVAARGGFNRSLSEIDFALAFGLSTRLPGEAAGLRSFDRLARELPAGRRARFRQALIRSLPQRHDAVRVAIRTGGGRRARIAVLPYVIYGGAASTRIRVIAARPAR